MELQYRFERFFTPKWYLFGFIPVGDNLIRENTTMWSRKVGETGWTIVPEIYTDFVETNDGQRYPRVTEIPA